MFPTCSIFIVINESRQRLTAPRVIDGVEAYEVLCPVSKLTGHRENPLSLLKSLMNDPVKSRQLDAFLQELPTIDVSKGLSDDDMVDLMMDRLSTGTPAEDDKYRRMLESVAGDILNSLGVSESKVEAVKSDSPEDVSIG